MSLLVPFTTDAQSWEETKAGASAVATAATTGVGGPWFATCSRSSAFSSVISTVGAINGTPRAHVFVKHVRFGIEGDVLL